MLSPRTGETVVGDPVKEIMKTAFDNGINLFDTAELYGTGKCDEEMYGTSKMLLRFTYSRLDEQGKSDQGAGLATFGLGYRNQDILGTSPLQGSQRWRFIEKTVRVSPQTLARRYLELRP